MNIVAAHVVDEASVPKPVPCYQLDLFTDYEALQIKQATEDAGLARERKMQKTILSIKNKFGKNAILKGMILEVGAIMRDRNDQIEGI